MTPKQQRAIAEACGFSNISMGYPESELVGTFNGKRTIVPNYPSDLNAMHEAEEILDICQLSNYFAYLTDKQFHNDSPNRALCIVAIHATASQRAEAFLRTIGKWQTARKVEPTKPKTTNQI